MFVFGVLISNAIMTSVAHTHINASGELEVSRSKLILRPCKSTMKVYSVLDVQDRRAIVVITGAHNHPSNKRCKLTHTSKEGYKAAVNSVGLIGATVGKVDKGMI